MELRAIRLLILVVVTVTVPLQAQDTSISSFSVQQTNSSVRIALTFNNDVSVSEMSGCFFDKLTFLNSDTSNSDDGFTPRYPGLCDFSSQSRDTLIGTMDIRDFINAIPLLMSETSSNIVLQGGSSVSLVPGISVNPSSRPLSASTFTPFTGRPNLISFDVDFSTDRLLLHFDGLLETSTFGRNQITLSSDTAPMPTNSVTLTGGLIVDPSLYSTTLCITLSPGDSTLIIEMNVCLTSCYCSITDTLISDYVGNAVAATDSLQVSILRRSSSSSLAVFMRLSLQYIGCTAIHHLAEDEVFVVRPNEYVTRMDCFTNNAVNTSNVQPQISRGSSFSGSADVTIDDYVVYNWPLNVYLNFSGAPISQLYGHYVCRSSIGYYIRNYVHDNNSNIELPDGSRYRLPVYDPLTFSLYFGSYPRIDLSQSSIDIRLVDAISGAGIAIEPVLERRNPFHVDIEYAMIQTDVDGVYEIRIITGSTVIARQPITIEVTPPVLTLLPEVAAVLPGQEEVILSCTTNSDRLSVRWSSGNSNSILSFNSTYRVELTSAIPSYNCSIIDPMTDTVLVSAAVPVINVQEILSVWRDGNLIENNSFVEVPNSHSGDLDLQCIEHSASTNLTWFVLPDNESLVAPSSGKDGDTYRVIASGNQASLSIDNALEPFRGLLKCWSSSGEVVSIRVVADDVAEPRTCVEEIDSVFGIQWIETIAGNRDFEPCPGTRGITTGFAIRLCNENGNWNDTIYINDCSSGNFIDLQNMAEDMVFRLRKAYNPAGLEDVVSQLIRSFNVTIQPKPITHFPRDLDVAIDILESLVDLLSEEPLMTTHTELVDVLDSLFHANNTEGWQLLTKVNEGGQKLLNISENFGLYLLQSLTVGGGQQELTVQGDNIVFSANLIMRYDQDIVYPADLSRGAQITMPASLLNLTQPNGVVHAVMNNLNAFLPKPESMIKSDGLRVDSSVFSSQIINASGAVTRIGGNQNITIQFLTEGVPRATDPVCLYWDDMNALRSQWSNMELNGALLGVSSGEIKQFKVNCSSDRVAAFGVAVTTDAFEFNFSIPVYVGCGFVIFSSVLSIFSLLLSCVCDKLRRHSMVAFFIHLSFIASVLCAYVAFVAGLEQALNQRIGCVAVAGLLHYFFTAAFAWLFMEALLLIFFQTFSKYYGLFTIVFLIGWGLPAIPTAISLGILHESYGTTQHCWFFFDGIVSDGVVLGFLIPKLLFIAATLVMLVIGCCTNYKFSNKKIQPYIKGDVTRMLWLIWWSVCVFLIFLAASWVFALLLVNVYGIDSEVLGWIFMVASILLGVWMFVFSFIVMVINQKVDYDRLWTLPDPVYPSSDPGKGKGYQFMNMPEVDLTGRRTSTLTRSPPVLSNPAFGLETD